jgi:hypothetical protein
MIGTSLPQYVFIRTCTLGLRAITPLSVFYVAFSIAEPPSSWAGRALLSWCALEAAFWLLAYLPRKRALHAAAKHPPTVPREARQELFQKCAEHIPNPEHYLSKWFLGARSFEVRRDNVKDFMAWAMLNRGDGEATQGEESREQDEELDGYVDGIENILGRKIQPGRGTAKSLRLTIDKIGMLHRPFLWYCVSLGRGQPLTRDGTKPSRSSELSIV